MAREGHIAMNDTHIGIWEETVGEVDFKREVYDKTIRHLRGRGFKVFRCPQTKKHYPSISKHHHKGLKGKFELTLRLCGRHIEVEFFQNINRSNPNGGQYDFDKFKRMPYLMQKQFIFEAARLVGMLRNRFGYHLDKKLLYAEKGATTVEMVSKAVHGIHPTKEPLIRFNDMWSATRFTRDESGWPVVREYDHGGNKDREGVSLRNGMIRYFRDRSGYLKRGIIYTNMNSMWQIVYGPGRSDQTFLHSSELFTRQTTDHLGRWIPDKTRKKIQKHILDKEIKGMNFEKASTLRDIIYPNLNHRQT